MKLALLGGGGFRVPLVYGALLRDTHERRVTEVTLYDTDAARLEVMGHVVHQMAQEAKDAGLEPPTVTPTGMLSEAVEGADFVFSAIRVGGLHGRTQDERVALDLGVLGQETTGPGGLAYGLRTIPVALEIARTVAALAPKAWLINFTNPAGMITEAMSSVLGDRVVGICDSPVGLATRVAYAAGTRLHDVTLDYIGLNHLGWLRGMYDDRGVDLLPGVLASDEALLGMEEGRLFGPDWLRTIEAVPNEYLYYWYFTRDAISQITQAEATRGEFLQRQQQAFYEAARADPTTALRQWHACRAEREATYMAETRDEDEERDETDLAGNGYEGVALGLMAAMSRGEPSRMILNLRAGQLVPGLDRDSVIEVPCHVGAEGPTPLPARALGGHMLGLVQQMKAVEQLTIRAAIEGDESLAVAAFAEHPLVDSVTVARVLLAGYRARIPEVDAVFG